MRKCRRPNTLFFVFLAEPSDADGDTLPSSFDILSSLLLLLLLLLLRAPPPLLRAPSAAAAPSLVTILATSLS